MYIICGWYTLILSILGLIIIILKDGESKTNYTGGYKLISIILNMPAIYFVWVTLFN